MELLNSPWAETAKTFLILLGFCYLTHKLLWSSEDDANVNEAVELVNKPNHSRRFPNE